MSARSNILFLLSDEHSFRYLSCLPDDGLREPVTTPNLDAIAEAGCRFSTTYCQVPLCSPSRICLLTGRSPMGSGGWDNCSVLRPGVATLPELLGEAGYATALVGKMHLGGNRQYVGFQHRPYGDLTGKAGHQSDPLPSPKSPENRGGNGMVSRTADAGVSTIPEAMLQENLTARTSVSWLREHTAATPEQPWFLCASFSRPHFPLTAPPRHLDRYLGKVPPPKVGRTGDTADHPMTRGMAEGFKTERIDHDEMMRARAAYFANVSFFDEMIGDFLGDLDRSGLLDNTIIVYTSDHGELAGEHGMWWKNSWHEAAARVPWIVQTPAHRRGEQSPAVLDTPVSLADLLPTLCGFAGVTFPTDIDGVDLSHAVSSGSEPQREPVTFVNPTPRWGDGCDNVVVRDGRWKYVRFSGVEPNLLFDLEGDPFEQRNMTDSKPEIVERLDEIARQTWDFDGAHAQQKADEEMAAGFALDAPHAGNAWQLADGRIIDAEHHLYDPRVLVASAADTFPDHPQSLV